MKKKVAIIDYGVGNTLSVFNAIKYLGYDVCITREASVIAKAHALILPGVGAFEVAINNIKKLHLNEILNEQVLVKKQPILGICLGMQLMASDSEENGYFKGLDWIPGNVKKIQLPVEFSVPHVGWNNIDICIDAPVFERVSDEPHFYFDHSYHYVCDKKNIGAVCNYGLPIVSAVIKENIVGVQFHPEKSQTNGLKLFKGFLNSV